MPDEQLPRQTEEELLAEQMSPDAEINPLGNEGQLFINPANPQPKKPKNEPAEPQAAQPESGQPSAPLAQKDGSPPPTVAELRKVAEVRRMIAAKQYIPAAAMVLRDPRLRQLLGQSFVRDLMVKMGIQQAKRKLEQWILTLTSEFWVPALIVIACVIALAIGLIIIQKKTLDIPPLTQNLAGDQANEAGFYFNPNFATSVMKVQSGSGINARTKELHFEATAGGVVGEELVQKVGNTWCWISKSTSCLAMGDQIKSSVTADQMQYYVNTRFPYIYGGTFDCPAKCAIGRPLGGNWGSINDYAGRMMWVLNPKTKKAVATIVAEWGPEPWFGVCTAANSPTTDTSNKRTVTLCPDQRANWNNRPIVSNKTSYAASKFDATRADALSVAPPAGYSGATLGMPKPAMDAIGLTDNNQLVIYGWATDQSVTPGTVRTLTSADLVTQGASTNGSKALPVPGISEGEHADCGDASLAMLFTYYLSQHGTSIPSYDNLPLEIQKRLANVDSSNWSAQGHFMTKAGDGNVCYQDTGLTDKIRADTSHHGDLLPSDIVRVTGVKSVSDLAPVLNSLSAGDPVVFYGKPCGMWCATKHIYVLVGYDATRKEFIVNNPNVNHVDIGVFGADATPPGNPQTQQHLIDTEGEGQYVQTFIMRKKYCTGNLVCVPL